MLLQRVARGQAAETVSFPQGGDLGHSERNGGCAMHRRGGAPRQAGAWQSIRGMSKWLGLAVVVFGAAPAWSAPAVVPESALSWSGLALRSLEDNPRIMAAVANLAATRERWEAQGLADLLPQVNGSLGMVHQGSRWRQGGERVVTVSDPIRGGVTLSQAVFNRRLWLNWQLADPMVAAAVADLETAKQGVLLQLAEASVGYLQAEEVAKLSESNLKVAKRHLGATRARFEVGEITRTEVSQAEANASMAEAEVTRAKSEVIQARSRLEEVVGQEVSKPVKVPWLTLTGLLDLAGERLTRAVGDRPDIQGKVARKRAADQGIEVASAGHWPSVGVNAGVNRRWRHDTPGRGDPMDDWTVGVEVSIPLYAGGKVVSQEEQARAERDGQQAELDRLQRQGVREVEQAIQEHLSASGSEKAYRVAVKAAADALRGMEEEYRIGTRSSLDLMDAESKWYQSLTNLAKSRYAMNLSQYHLVAAVGRLSLDELVARKAAAPF